MAIVEKQGLAALTYESLAAESGLSKSGLIYYFPSRQTLLLEINRFLAAQWEEKMVELAGGPAHEVDKRERIRASFLVMSQSATLADLLQIIADGLWVHDHINGFSLSPQQRQQFTQQALMLFHPDPG